MKYYFLAGEPSGDLHASNCMREIIKLDDKADFAFTGGDLMESLTGKKAAIHIKQMAFMGFIRVLQNIFTIKKNFKIVKEDILRYKPDLLVLVDYPGLINSLRSKVPMESISRRRQKLLGQFDHILRPS